MSSDFQIPVHRDLVGAREKGPLLYEWQADKGKLEECVTPEKQQPKTPPVLTVLRTAPEQCPGWQRCSWWWEMLGILCKVIQECSVWIWSPTALPFTRWRGSCVRVTSPACVKVCLCNGTRVQIQVFSFRFSGSSLSSWFKFKAERKDWSMKFVFISFLSWHDCGPKKQFLLHISRHFT